MYRIYLLVVCLMFSQGCGYFILKMEESRAKRYPKPTIVERQEYLKNNTHLSEWIKSEVRKGRVTKGMSKSDVIASWGSPVGIRKSRKKMDYDEVWEFRPHWKVRNYVYFKAGTVVGGDPDPDDLI